MTGFVIEWQRDTSVGCSDEDEGRVSVNGAFTSYIITGREPGNRYTITVTVSNSAGSSGVTVTAMTEETGREAKIFNTQKHLGLSPPQLPLGLLMRLMNLLSLPILSQSSGERCPVSTVMER